MKKTIKLLICIIAIFLFYTVFIKVNAASAGLSVNKSQVEVGTTVNVSVNINAASWEIHVSGPVTGNYSDVSSDGNNTSRSESLSFTPSTPGTYTIELSGNVTDESSVDGKAINVGDKKNITVVEKSGQQSTNNNNNNNNANQNNQPVQEKDPTFTSTNQTMYTTGGINLRSSWSTNSAATSVPAGTEVTVTGTSTDKVNGYTWYRVTYNGQTKYVASGLLTATKPEEDKEKSTNKALKDLVVENYKLTPEFSPDTTKYSVTVDNKVDKLEISAITQDENAKVEITKNADFKVGENVVYITVTAEDGTTRLYTIAVTKTKDDAETSTDKLKLKKLEVKNASLSPSFDATTTNYTITMDDPASLKKEDITALAEDADAEVKVALSEMDANNERLITIMVEKGEGDDKQSGTYQITVKKAAFNPVNEIAKNKDNKIYYILGAIIGALLIFIIIIIVLLKKTSNDDDYDFQDEDELDDSYDYSLKNAIDEAKNETAEDINPQYDEIVENSNVKSQILNPTDYNVFEDQGNGVGAPEETRRYNFNDDDDFDPKPKKRGKHF